jgi:hypothetical protein
MHVEPAYKHSVYYPLTLFSSIIFFVCLGDAIMSYAIPVYFLQVLKDPFMTGLIISTSSFFGMFFDILVAKNLWKKSYGFFILWTIVFALLFPLILWFLPAHIGVFVISMIVWSVYYELRDFSKFNFIHSFVDSSKHVLSWSIVASFQATAYMIGPGLAVLLISKYGHFPFNITALAFLPSVLIFFVFMALYKKHNKTLAVTKPNPKSFYKEMKIIRTLGKRVWPLFMYTMAVTLIDVSFWVTGVLFAEQLRKTNELGGMFLIVYGIPSIYCGLLAGKFLKSSGKKHVAFILGISCGLGMMLIGTLQNIYLLLLMVLVVSTLYGLVTILLAAVFEDYVARLNMFGDDMVSISQSSKNFAYWIGPIALGLLAEFTGLQLTFSAVGVFIVVISMLALVLVPWKIKMPQKELVTDLVS